MRLPDSFKPRPRGLRLPGDESPELSFTLRAPRWRIRGLWDAPAELEAASFMLWLLVAALTIAVLKGHPAMLLPWLAAFAAFASVRARTRGPAGGSRSFATASIGTAAAASGALAWITDIRPGEYLLFFIVSGAVPVAATWLVFAAIAATCERRVAPLRAARAPGAR